jgi:carbon monoxide dehydrogenase subunit G
MECSTSIEISKPRADVWEAITDIQNAAGMISGIMSLEVLENPETGLVGFKWKETRKMFGKEATEIMWVTDAEENEYYRTRAESHGSVYKTRLSLSDEGGRTRLTMTFTGEPRTMGAKVMSFFMGGLMKGSMEKELLKDLADIKKFVEQS